MGILSAFRFAFQNVFFTPVLYGVIASLAVFSATWEKGDRLKDQLTDRFRNQEDTFDFIVVGGGSAGAVVANRLSQWHSVLLLEAGGESHPFQAIPALSLFIPNYPATDWSHKSITQPTTCLICTKKRFTFSQGKNLGGSGNLNYLIHLRGSPKDFDNWARITGDQRWSYQGVKQDFCNSENFEGTTTDPSAHGKGGPLNIQMPTEIGLANEWNWAGQEMGYRHLDLNGNYDEGFDAVYYPIKRGIRQATYRAYIQPARKRASLVIRKFAHVNKVLIREGSNDAYGVSYDRHGKKKYAFANKEVILSAGTLQTPKILMLSGIGPRANLQHLKIPVKSDLPVGQNLHDHVSTLLGPFFVNSPKTFSYDDDVTASSFLTFATQGKGPLTTSGFQATALVASSFAKARGQAGWPDIQLTLFGMTPHRLFASDFAHAFGLKESILQRYYLHARGKSAFFILVSVARPESRGDLCLHSTDPYKPLEINPKFYTDAGNNDMNVMIEGIHRALYIAENTTAFQSCKTKYSPKTFPGCENHVFRSNGYWECYARHFTITLNDQVGTCAMGYATSPYSVVDPELKVMGVNNLRVVDASVMPAIVGANTQASTIMIGEKGAAFLLEKWKGEAKNFGGDLKPEYGPPGGVATGGSVTPGQNSVTDDGSASLVPPGVGAVDNYENYDSFTLLRGQGSSPSQVVPGSNELNVGGEPVPSSPDPSSLLLPPGLRSDALPSEAPTPPIYREVYDPVSSNARSSVSQPTPLTEEEASNVSASGRGRGSKDFGGGDFFPTEAGSTPSAPSDFLNNLTLGSPSSTPRGPVNKNNSVVILRRRKRPPNVSIHPRGHLGYEDVSRRPKTLMTPAYNSLTTPSTPTTSILPLPKEIVTIKRRRPASTTSRRRLKPTTPLTPDEFELQRASPTSSSLSFDELPSAVTLPIGDITSTSVSTGISFSNPSTARQVRFASNVNSTKVSKSVSAVITRLRNFIPPNTRDKRGQRSNVKRKVSRGSGGGGGGGSSAQRVDLVEDKEREDDDDDDDSEMIIFSDVKIDENGEGVDMSRGRSPEGEVKQGQSSRRGGGGVAEEESEEESQPMMPMDMDPLPKIIANSKSLLIPPKERNVRTRISSYQKARRKRQLAFKLLANYSSFY